MHEAPRTTGWAPGAWRPWKHPIFPGPTWQDTVALECPVCGRAFCLVNHSVDSNGNVQPSVVCPFNCGFHVFMRLNDYGSHARGPTEKDP
jgi:hypothetical protein